MEGESKTYWTVKVIAGIDNHDLELARKELAKVGGILA